MSKIDTAALTASFLSSGRAITVCPTRNLGSKQVRTPNAMSAEGKRQRALYEETRAL